MFILAAVVAAVLALLMHLFGWGAGKLDVLTVFLAAFTSLCLHLATSWWPARHGG